MARDLTPSNRKNGAQRMLAATTLSCEALLALFAGLVAHGLSPETRLWSWALALFIMVTLFATSARLGRGGAGVYWLGVVLQVPLILFGIFLPVMYVVGFIFAVLYWWGVVKGHTMDREKDAVDRKFQAANDSVAP